MRIYEDIIDSLTPSDLKQHTSVQDVTEVTELERFPELIPSQFIEQYRCSFRFSFLNLDDITSSDTDFLISRITDIFDACSHIINYKLCRISGDLIGQFYTDGVFFDVAFNIRSWYVIPYMEKFLFPLLTSIYDYQEKHTMTFQVIFSERIQQGGICVPPEMINRIIKQKKSKSIKMPREFSFNIMNYVFEVCRPFALNQPLKYKGFFLSLMRFVFKNRWKRQFEMMTPAENGRTVNLHLSIYSSATNTLSSANISVFAPDYVTMGLKLFLIAAFRNISINSAINYYEKDNYRKEFIPMSDDIVDMNSWLSYLKREGRWDILQGLVDGSPYYDIVRWMRYNASTYQNHAPGEEIEKKLQEFGQKRARFKI